MRQENNVPSYPFNFNIQESIDVARARQIVLNNESEAMPELIELIRLNNLRGLDNMNNYISRDAHWPGELERAMYRFSIVREIAKCAEALQNRIDGRSPTSYLFQNNLTNGF